MVKGRKIREYEEKGQVNKQHSTEYTMLNWLLSSSDKLVSMHDYSAASIKIQGG